MNHDHRPKPRPSDVVRDGQYKISLWRNEGKERDYISAQPAKTYTDKDGNPRDTQNFSLRDLLPLSRLCEVAYERGRELDKELKQQQEPSQGKPYNGKAQNDDRSARKSAYAQKREGGPRRQSRYVRDQ